MYIYSENFEDFLTTTAEMLVAEGLPDVADLLKSSELARS